MLQLHDALELGTPRRTRDGFLAVRARAARAGVYDYLGAEVDPKGERFAADAIVKVYRPADEVFAKDSVASFFAKPITDDHPKEAVTADNWRRHARGAVMGALRDREHLAFDLALMDGEAIDAVDSGKRELSNGYTCDISFEDGTAPDGTAYQAVQRNIRGNHVALVNRGRAGPECRIGDGGGGSAFAVCDANPEAVAGLISTENNVKTITLDGLPVNLGDAAAVEAAIGKLQKQIADGATALTTANDKVSTLTGEKAALETKVADLEAKLAPAVLDKAVADRASLVATIKALDASIQTDGKTDAELRKAVVTAKLGDAAADMDDAAIAGAFAVLAKDAKPVKSNVAPIGQPVVTDDAGKLAELYDKMVADLKAASQPQAA